MARWAAADEGRHAGDGDPAWREGWAFDGWAPDGSWGWSTALVLWPERHRAWYWAALVRAGEPLLHLADLDLGVPRALELRSHGLWASHVCEAPFEQWTVANEAYAVILDDPFDALGRAHGTPTPVAFDLEWYATSRPSALRGTEASPSETAETDAPASGIEEAAPASGIEEAARASALGEAASASRIEEAAPASALGEAAPTGYVQEGEVHGVIELAAGPLQLEGPAPRRHWWGHLDPWSPPDRNWPPPGPAAPVLLDDGPGPGRVLERVLTTTGWREAVRPR